MGTNAIRHSIVPIVLFFRAPSNFHTQNSRSNFKKQNQMSLHSCLFRSQLSPTSTACTMCQTVCYADKGRIFRFINYHNFECCNIHVCACYLVHTHTHTHMNLLSDLRKQKLFQTRIFTEIFNFPLGIYFSANSTKIFFIYTDEESTPSPLQMLQNT